MLERNSLNGIIYNGYGGSHVCIQMVFYCSLVYARLRVEKAIKCHLNAVKLRIDLR